MSRFEVQRLRDDGEIAALNPPSARESEGAGGYLDWIIVDHNATPLRRVVCKTTLEWAVMLVVLLNDELETKD